MRGPFKEMARSGFGRPVAVVALTLCPPGNPARPLDYFAGRRRGLSEIHVDGARAVAIMPAQSKEAGTAMRRTLAVLAGLAALPALGGCAAVGNLGAKDGCKVYGGTRVDAALVSQGFGPYPDTAKSEGIEHAALVWAGFCGLADMPLSLVADTVLLPITVPVAASRPAADSHPSEPAPKDQ
jgi:uncharacterized protein YceK